MLGRYMVKLMDAQMAFSPIMANYSCPCYDGGDWQWFLHPSPFTILRKSAMRLVLTIDWLHKILQVNEPNRGFS